MPFGLDDTSAFRIPEEYFKNVDQLYRYTVDKNLAPSSIIEGFIRGTFYEQLQGHSREFDRLIPLIIGNGSHAPIDEPQA